MKQVVQGKLNLKTKYLLEFNNFRLPTRYFLKKFQLVILLYSSTE